MDTSRSKFLGGILLIIGTSIGGGMLALPLSTAEAGFSNSLFFLALCWLVMVIGALLILEVNLRLPPGSNIISMAKSTLGLPGQICAWITYLLMLYTLLSGYIAGGSDVLNNILQHAGVLIPQWLASLIFTTLFGLVVYHGIHAVDFVNRGFMLGKFVVYLILVLIISPHIDVHALTGGKIKAISGSLLILVTSFGFASIVPTLRTYFHDDVKALRRVILAGSLIPLLCYIVWDAVIMGIISRDGDGGLIALASAEHATSGLSNAISAAVQNNIIASCFGFFASICMVTAFLGVSIGLFDFLADGLRLEKKGMQGSVIMTLTFVPPLVVVLFKPGIYLMAMAYAGFCCVILLLLMPALMSWRARTMAENKMQHLVPGGNIVLSGVILAALFLLKMALQ